MPRICIRTIGREFFPQFVEMPDRPPPLFRHIARAPDYHVSLFA